ncbi:MAG: GIY-YIG nuclease family protein [Candidatus Scalindua sp.]
MSSREFGYLDNPANGLDIIRARTLVGNLRLWDIPKSEEALEIVINEIDNSPIPGIYMLFDKRSDKKVYIGQSEDLKSRLVTHVKSPDEKIKNWERVIIINDARNASQSDLNDENIRLNLENYLISLFKINRYKVTTFSSRKPSLSATQKALVKSFKEELVVLLTRKSKITKVLTERGDDEVYNDEVKKILKRKKYKIDEWGKVEAVINGMKTFIRAGSSKPKGW